MRYRLIVTLCLIIILVSVGVLAKVKLPYTGKDFQYVTVQQVSSSFDHKITTVKASKVNYFKGIDFYPAPLPYESEEGSLALDSLLETKAANFVGLRFFLESKSRHLLWFSMIQTKTQSWQTSLPEFMSQAKEFV